MKLVSLVCTQCGAQLPQQKQADTYQCSYCNSRFEAPTTPPPAPSAPPPVAPAADPAPVAAAKKGAVTRLVAAVISIGGLLPFLFGGLMFYRSMSPMVKGSVSAIRLGSLGRALWDRVGGLPVPAVIAGKEAILGRMRLTDDQLFIVATDAATARPLWKLGPLGTYGDGYRQTFFTVAADRVVVSDARATLHIYELQTGKQLKAIPLLDSATNVCPAGPNSVAVAVLDRHHMALDLGSLTLSEASLPSDCETQRSSISRERRGDSQRVHKPVVRGFEINDVHAEGELAVAAAVKKPGTPIPYAIGFAPKTREVRWQQLLPTVDPMTVRESDYDALAGGRYLAIYGVGSGNWHLTALDANNGARLWDVALRPLFAVDLIEGLVVTAQYAYVNRSSSLEIYDTASGRLIGTVGNDTYR